MKRFFKRYRIFLILLTVYLVLFFADRTLYTQSSAKTVNSLVEMIQVLPPVFILLGLLDVWVKRETMVKAMGKGSGIKGVLLGFFLGSAAAGPLYAAFPVALTLLKKGSSMRNVLIMIGAWSTTKIPLLMFEAASMGLAFTLTRFFLNLIGIFGIAWVIEALLNESDHVAIEARIATLEA